MAQTGTRNRPVKTAARKGSGSSTLILIGIYKLLEALLLIAAGIGALRMLHRDIQTVALHWVHVLRVDPENRYIHMALQKVFSIKPKQLEAFSVGTFLYAGLRLAEGYGLVLRKRWAEYLTIVSTAVFIPLEIYEIFHRFRMLKLGILALNLAILWFLIVNLRKTARR